MERIQSPSCTTPKLFNSYKHCINFISQELRITVLLFAWNFYVVFGGNIQEVFIVCAMYPVTALDLFRVLLHCIFNFFIMQYIFDIANQTFSVDEDKLNKPHRPIPAGLLSLQGAYIRLILSWTLGPIFLLYYYGAAVFTYVITWQFVICIWYIWPRPGHWIWKIMFNMITYFLVSLWVSEYLTVINEEWRLSLVAILLPTAWFTLSNPLQDFVEVKGDRAIGRKTLPIILGPRGMHYLRLYLAFIFGGTGLIVSICTLYYTQESSLANIAMIFGSVHMITATVLAIRVFFGRTAQMDRTTYCIFYYFGLFSFEVQVRIIERCINMSSQH